MNNREAIVVISELIEFYESENLKEAFKLAVKALEERPTGHWIVDEEHSITMTLYKCTNCDYFGGALHYNYCPHCGADKRGGKE